MSASAKTTSAASDTKTTAAAEVVRPSWKQSIADANATIHEETKDIVVSNVSEETKCFPAPKGWTTLRNADHKAVIYTADLLPYTSIAASIAGTPLMQETLSGRSIRVHDVVTSKTTIVTANTYDMIEPMQISLLLAKITSSPVTVVLAQRLTSPCASNIARFKKLYGDASVSVSAIADVPKPGESCSQACDRARKLQDALARDSVLLLLSPNWKNPTTYFFSPTESFVDVLLGTSFSAVIVRQRCRWIQALGAADVKKLRAVYDIYAPVDAWNFASSFPGDEVKMNMDDKYKRLVAFVFLRRKASV